MKNIEKNTKGFTLIELLVVVLIIGILSAVAIPRYGKTVETSKAQTAAAAVKMIGMTNRMFRLDNGFYTEGILPDPESCTGDACNLEGYGAGNLPTACILMECRYLGKEKWSGKNYDFETLGGADNAGCGCPTGKYVACAKRTDDGKVKDPYLKWAYAVDKDGVLVNCNEAPVVN